MRKLGRILVIVILTLFLAFYILRNPDKSVETLKKQYADQESEWLSLKGMNVHYKEEGNGPPLLLLHGTGASLHTWDEWTERLSNDLTIYRLDLPAFGLTGPDPKRDYSIESYIDFVNEFAIAQALDTFYLAGNSLGGYIAWAYAVKHPEKVSKLILLDAAGYPHEGDTDALAFKIATNPILRPLMKHITPKSFIRKNLEQVYYDDSKISKDLVNRYHDMALRAGNRQAFIDRVHTEHADISDRIKEIKCPTLIMWGKEDTWADVSDASKFNQDISGSRLIFYERVGHVPMEESPEQTADDALQFLMDVYPIGNDL